MSLESKDFISHEETDFSEAPLPKRPFLQKLMEGIDKPVRWIMKHEIEIVGAIAIPVVPWLISIKSIPQHATEIINTGARIGIPLALGLMAVDVYAAKRGISYSSLQEK